MKIRIMLALCMLSSLAHAQDLEFSQFYASPLLLNPGFAGTTDSHRFSANYRNQWPSIANGFVSYGASYDMMLPELKSGVGLLFVGDKAGTAGLKSQVVTAVYSYKIRVANKVVISPGLGFGLGTRSIDYNKLLFGDQLDFDANGLPTSALFPRASTTYFDFNASLLMYNRNFWIGSTISHLNKPNRALLDDVATLPRKLSVHGGFRVNIARSPLRKNSTVVMLPSWNYKRQAQFQQLDAGAQLYLDPLVIGLWYRGIPISKDFAGRSVKDAIVAMMGFQFENLEVMYSYDMTISQLGPSTGGAHEISIKYELPRSRDLSKKIKHKLIPCPTIYRNRDLNMDKLRQ